ncbi:hypothetical protein M9M90_05080 [Phenylobacterium sp. LH3H17]|uniref:hypothetical protein n=1 Tax=Phenylobacterium sp. LH3H17 TaxID=2903901 RepID=UPI0020C9F505|nr:hypothetical protein [Phenylobacterium sp. LH3H17]UTP40559.1 hypothetical protein M9M90_05080 [Phenylobacterium sp. LH3H17]
MKTPDISQALVGGILVADAAGHYPGLELLNYVYGSEDGVLANGENPKFVRTAQDFARRLVWDPERFADTAAGREVFVGDGAEEVLRQLLKCLQLPVPDRKTPNWEAAHFFPYTRSLIHWDARNARSQSRGVVQIERRYLRGGGALAYKVLRQDPDSRRLDAIRDGFAAMMPDEGATPLERLAQVLATHSRPTAATACSVEAAANPPEDELDRQYRDGIASILSHTDLSSTARVKAVVNWTGFWLALCQRDRAAERLEARRPPAVVDCGSGPSQLRRESARGLKEIVAVIGEAAEACLPEGDELKAKARRDLAGFFTRTCAWTGLINAFSGKRHFAIGLDLLEALVLALVPLDQERPFEVFAGEDLHARFGLVIGRSAAAAEGLLGRLDASLFEDNEQAFARQLEAAGLLKSYSDTTRMVGTKALR